MTDRKPPVLIPDDDRVSPQVAIGLMFPTASTKARHILDVCRRLGLSVATAESITAGNIQAALSSVSGASDYFQGGVTAYNLDQKVKLLGVDREMAEACNCVSGNVAAQMAHGARDLFQTDIAIATTGYAEPCPAEGIVEPFVHIVVLYPRASAASGWAEAHAKLEDTQATRIEAQQAVTEVALIMLIQALEEMCGSHGGDGEGS